MRVIREKHGALLGESGLRRLLQRPGEIDRIDSTLAGGPRQDLPIAMGKRVAAALRRTVCPQQMLVDALAGGDEKDEVRPRRGQNGRQVCLQARRRFTACHVHIHSQKGKRLPRGEMPEKRALGFFFLVPAPPTIRE